MTRSGKQELRATSQRMRRRNVITLMKKERTLMMKGQGTGNQVLPRSGVCDRVNIVHELDHEPVFCVNFDTLDFLEED